MKNGNDASSGGNMRNGLISLLTVVVILCLATAAVLAVSTSHAMHSLAERQAQMTGEGYAAERSGQAMLAGVDEILAKARNAGEGAEAAASRVGKKVNEILVTACADDVLATYDLDGTTLTCTFTTPGRRQLEVELEITEDASYSILGWRLTAAPEELETGDMLWTGSTANE